MDSSLGSGGVEIDVFSRQAVPRFQNQIPPPPESKVDGTTSPQVHDC